MELQDVLRSLWRRWYIVVVGLIAAAGAAFGLLTVIPPTYSQVSTSFMAPGKGSVEPGDNPLLYLGGLTQQRDLVVRAVQADSVREPILETHPGADFAVTPDFSVSGPVVMVTATGQTPAATTAILDAATAAVAKQLEDLQIEVGTPATARTTIYNVPIDSEPKIVRKQQLQLTVVGTGGVLLLALFLAVLIDGRSQARVRRKQTTEPEDPVTDDHVLEAPRPQGTISAPPTTMISAVHIGPASGPPRRRELQAVLHHTEAAGQGVSNGHDEAGRANAETFFQRRSAGSV
ncbi:lipopolysaccharide biosynthesis protein [Xylanimonas cellulosilytica DSM 15894]|uniref:Lipopolysaccharide biosynthesis protein n=1 Tax=Xylanimonas cellulosilytica (strain DSM 15894 / JCM 12276 / CECT 5975 / KCTC 9989 / LMG 20990 / NBRC 107835 / XIL07) TaxID=446471 RepID=D1BXR9_XYLCX|nr:hypothetical protein [Xylanimonas cellulosilytica]ACZ31710.1 lipopolysaccharide biosynthesis protein [Xylanimonas cellulosilytica DSM 15894]